MSVCGLTYIVLYQVQNCINQGAKRGMLTPCRMNKPQRSPFVPSYPTPNIIIRSIHTLLLLSPYHKHIYRPANPHTPSQPHSTHSISSHPRPNIPIQTSKLFTRSHTAAECSSTRSCRNRDTASFPARCLRALRLSRWRWRGGRS